MVIVRISRESIEVAAESPAVAGVTRLDSEVASLSQETVTAVRVRASRFSCEVVGRLAAAASLTRLDGEVGVLAQPATTGTVRASRVSVECAAQVIKRASLTRLDAEVAVPSQAVTTGSVKVSRVSMEAVARRGSAGPVSPLALAGGIDVFLHNWVDEAVLRTAYMTDISTSPNTCAESRRSLALKPERTLSLFWQIHSSDTAQRERLDRLIVMLRKLTNERVAVPLYMDQRVLDVAYASGTDTVLFDTTKTRFFNGARVVIIQTDFEGLYESHSFHLISIVQDTSLKFTANLGVNVRAGSIIIPMIDCEITLEAKTKLVTAGNMSVKLELQEVAGPSQLPPLKSDNPTDPQIFDDAPIFDYQPDWVDGIEKGRLRDGEKFSQGITSMVFAAGARSREWHKINFSGVRGACADGLRSDVWRVVEFFDTRLGRLRSFWHIDQDQVWDIESIDPAGAFIGVHEIGDFADFEDELEGEWIGIEMADGTFYVREAVTVQQVLTVFRITVGTALPAGLDINDVVRISRARRCRFNSDEIEERWKHSGYMSTTLEIIEVLEEKYVDT